MAQRIQVNPLGRWVTVPSPLSMKSVVGVVCVLAWVAGVVADAAALCAEQLPAASQAATL
jgi:hypothetical protein